MPSIAVSPIAVAWFLNYINSNNGLREKKEKKKSNSESIDSLHGAMDLALLEKQPSKNFVCSDFSVNCYVAFLSNKPTLWISDVGESDWIKHSSHFTQLGCEV